MAKKFSGILSRKQEVNSNAQQSRVINNGSTIAAMEDNGTLTVIAEQRQVDVTIGEDGHFQEVEREVTPKADPRDIIRQAARRRAAARTPKESSTPKEAIAPKEASTPKEADQMRQVAQDVTPEPATPAPKQPAPKKPSAKKTTPKEAPEKPRYTLMQYSEKCVALFGDTKPIKDELRRIGGRYNPSLHPFGQDTSIPGWVFPNKYRDDVEQLINRKQ